VFEKSNVGERIGACDRLIAARGRLLVIVVAC